MKIAIILLYEDKAISIVCNKRFEYLKASKSFTSFLDVFICDYKVSLLSFSRISFIALAIFLLLVSKNFS